MTDNPTPNDIALLREALKLATDALALYADPTGYTDNEGEQLSADAEMHEGLLAKHTLDRIATLAPGQHDGAAGEGQRELEYFNRTTCACTAAGTYVADCDKHGSKPSTEQARAEGAQTYAVDDRGLFCRHCGRASWLHHRVIGAGNFCVAPDATPSGADGARP